MLRPGLAINAAKAPRPSGVFAIPSGVRNLLFHSVQQEHFPRSLK